MPNSKIFRYYENYLADRDFGSDSPEDKARYLGVRPVGTGDVLEIPYRHYWELRKFKKLLPAKRPLRILELGCGSGRYAVSLAPLASKITAVDFSQVQLDVGIQDCKNAGINNVEFINASIMDYEPEAGECFDVIYFSGVLQYCSDEEIETILNRLRKFLSPSGVFIERSTVLKNAKRDVFESDTYFSIYRTSEELIGLFTKAGFTGREVGPAYQYLRFQKLWRNGVVRHGTRLMVRICPGLAYRGMALLSWFRDLFCGKGTKLPKSNGWAIHSFFVFKPKER